MNETTIQPPPPSRRSRRAPHPPEIRLPFGAPSSGFSIAGDHRDPPPPTPVRQEVSGMVGVGEYGEEIPVEFGQTKKEWPNWISFEHPPATERTVAVVRADRSGADAVDCGYYSQRSQRWYVRRGNTFVSSLHITAWTELPPHEAP